MKTIKKCNHNHPKRLDYLLMSTCIGCYELKFNFIWYLIRKRQKNNKL